MKSETLPQHEMVLKEIRLERSSEHQRLNKLRVRVAEQLKKFEVKAA